MITNVIRCNTLKSLCFLLISTYPCAAKTWSIRQWDQMLDYTSNSTITQYTPLAHAQKAWKICALYPHLKDSYWLSVNYGMVDQAKILGVELMVHEAGGYYQVKKQAEQLEQCAKSKPDAIVIGTVTFNRHQELIDKISKQIPVFGIVNRISPQGISAMTGVDWNMMGKMTGKFLQSLHPKGSPQVKIAWFPGAGKVGISSTKLSAFKQEIMPSSARLSVSRYGDTGKLEQLTLIEDVLDNSTNYDYIVGTGVTAEAAVSALRARHLTNKIKVISGYFTHSVYRGILRGKILASPSDQPALQGRMSIDQVVRFLENKRYVKHMAPEIIMITSQNISTFNKRDSLSPTSFKPTFHVAAP
ncbi:TMAO reductase system periplasmic protein TorT [Polycladidibacter stylochi]|uniref:TMAO reductase system periplasmic protein TorT n=1 Tax=Polycladidibacter stylochi TaxID=1807766 RepID=UPI00138F1155|nr:TMAO reductase system periplasmic protein TorT [Pseudovibrio stylochi]